MKRLVRRARADADVVAALDYYIAHASECAVPFIDDLESAYQHIRKYPASGSPRYAIELNIANIRAWKCRQYPYVIFYAESADCIDIWRVLHETRDIPTSFTWTDDAA